MVFFDMDKSTNDAARIGLTYKGVRILISRDRLLELLRNEEELHALLVSPDDRAAPLPAPAPALVAPAAPTADKRRAAIRVTHASLSNRVKKIHDYAGPARALRKAHVEFLSELLANFDWHLPEHPNARLERYLRDFASWDRVPDSLREQISTFLARYTEARQALKGTA